MADDTSNKKCISCKIPIEGEEKVIKCSGSCSGVIHQGCMDLKPSEIKIIERISNVKWFCNVCNDSQKLSNSQELMVSEIKLLHSKLEECMNLIKSQDIRHSEQFDKFNNLINIIENKKTNSNIDHGNTRAALVNTKNVNTQGENVKNNQLPQITDRNTGETEDLTLDKASSSYNKNKDRTTYSAKLRSNSTSSNLAIIDKSIPKIHNKSEENVNKQKTYGTSRYESHNPDDFTQVERRKKRVYFQKTVGTSATTDITNEGNQFTGAGRKVWLFITRVKNSVFEKDIENYLKKKTKTESSFTVEEIKSIKVNNCSKNFKISADYALKDELYNPEFWPLGVGYRRYDFRIEKTKIFHSHQQATSFLEEKIPV